LFHNPIFCSKSCRSTNFYLDMVKATISFAVHHFQNVMKKLYLLSLSILLLSAASVNAQLNYQVSNATNTSGTYTDLGTSGTVITTSNQDDANSAATPIGFTFSFNGLNFNDFILNTNGFIKLGTVAPSSPSLAYTGVAPTLLGPIESTDPLDVNLIAGFCHDLEAGPGGAEYRVATTGTAPNRVTTIQFKGVQDKAGNNPNNVAAPVQFSNIQFQIKLFETTNRIEVVFGPWTATTNASQFKAAASGIKGSSFTSGNFISTTKGSVAAYSTTTFVSTVPLAGNRLNFGNPPARPAPDAGRTFAFLPNVSNDLGVTVIEALGSAPTNLTYPQIIRARIANLGATAQTNFVVRLNITGANSRLDSVQVNSLAVGATTTVSFGAFNPANAGVNVITVSVPNDQNPTNNSRSIAQRFNTSGIFSYADTTTANASSWGFNGSVIAAIRVNANKPVGSNVTQVTAVRLPISATSGATGRILRAVVCDNAGNIIGQGTDYTVQAADLGTTLTLTFPSPVNVSDSTFLVGMFAERITGSPSWFPFTYQNENPGRAGAFYTIPATGGAPSERTDLERLALEAVIQSGNVPADLTVLSVFGSGRVPLGFGTDSVQMFARVRNLVGPTVTSLPVTLTVTGANPRSITANVAVSAGASATVTFPAYKPTAVGFDTIRVSIPNDGNISNNIATYIQEITSKTWHYHQVGTSATSFVGFNTTDAINDELFLNRFLINDTGSVFVTKVFAQIGTGATIPGIRMTAVVKTPAGAVVGQSAERVLTAADAGTTIEFNIIRDLTAAPFGPNQAFFAGVMYSKPTGAAAFPVGFQTEDPIRPTGNVSFRASGIAGAPVLTTQPWIYHITTEVANANAPNTISSFALTAPANNTSLTLAGPASTAVNVTWSPATDPAATGPINYTFLLDIAGGFTLGSAIQIVSNNGGVNPSLTLTYGVLDSLMELLQVPSGIPTDFEWSVVATSGANVRFASDTFLLTLTRGLVQFQLCTPSSTNNANDFINSFVLNGAASTSINSVTGRNTPTQYRDLFNTTAVSLLQNQSYTYTITMGIGSAGNTLVGAFTYRGAAIIDWNNNNGFSILDEGSVTNQASGDTVNFTPAVLTGTITVPAGQANGPYRMRVIAGDVTGVIQPCQVTFGDVEDYRIWVGTIGIESVAKFENSFFLFPNPANDKVRLTYTYDKPSNMQLTIMNSVGATVYNQQYSDLIDGQIDLSVENLQSGVYFVRATVDGVNTVQKLVIE
jgi:hypothetical protein